jgi:hypothetical protein
MISRELLMNQNVEKDYDNLPTREPMRAVGCSSRSKGYNNQSVQKIKKNRQRRQEKKAKQI